MEEGKVIQVILLGGIYYKLEKIGEFVVNTEGAFDPGEMQMADER